MSAPSAPALSPKISIWRKTGSITLGGLGGRRGGWGPEFEQAAPLDVTRHRPCSHWSIKFCCNKDVQ